MAFAFIDLQEADVAQSGLPEAGFLAQCKRAMPLPQEPVTLSVGELRELSRKLADMRHDVNNQLSLIVAAVEMIRHKPDSATRMVATLAEQPGRIGESVRKFSAEFDKAMGITRP